MKVRRVEDETKLQITKYNAPVYKKGRGHMNHKLQCPKLQTKKRESWLLVSKVGIVSELRRLKASKPCMPANSHELSNIRHLDAFAVGTVHLKKPSVGPKGLIGPPCHGAPLAAGGKEFS